VNKGSPDAEHASKEVTTVISRKVKPGYENEYDEWLRRYSMLEKKVPGYVGATIITQVGTDSAIRHIIYRFSDKASLDAWENSEEANKSSTRYYERATGLETWFALPDMKAIVAPPKWKMAIVSLFAAYCISTLSNYILSPFL
jgi:uncharacterized protein